ncbi:hypothetical protein Q6247_26700, partial [Klebsiella pneumoniae]
MHRMRFASGLHPISALPGIDRHGWSLEDENEREEKMKREYGSSCCRANSSPEKKAQVNDPNQNQSKERIPNEPSVARLVRSL